MFFQEVPSTRRYLEVAKINKQEGAVRCRKSAPVILGRASEPVLLCLDHARELAKEILDRVPGGKYDARVRAELKPWRRQ